jgi:uncharacterized protein YndB with AHSA1/START domain
MKLALIAAVVLFIAVIVVLAIAAAKPDKISVERSSLIRAPRASVFALINDFHNWSQWAPQDRDDPSIVRTFSGASAGVGAVSEWTSRGSAGAGRMQIILSKPDTEIEVHVDFHKPFVAHNINHFTLRAEGDETRLTWSMTGTNVFLMKLMSVFMNSDRMLGRHFEQGLSNLQASAAREMR